MFGKMQWLIDLIKESVNEVPPGAIFAYSGLASNTPSGYHRCDGTQGTPDLRDRFICAKGPSTGYGETGGLLSNAHNVICNPHGHTLESGATFGTGTGYAPTTDEPPVSGYTDTKENRPPYYVLLFIMKLFPT